MSACLRRRCARWVIGRDYPKGDSQATFHPLIKPAHQQPVQLSFYTLIEAHVLRSLRTEHGVALAELRKSITYAEKKLQVQRLLLSPDLRTHAGEIFLDRYVELISLSASGQLAMRVAFERHLQRVEWDEWQFPVRLYPTSIPPSTPPIAQSRLIPRLRSGVRLCGVLECRRLRSPTVSMPAKPSLL